MDAQERPPWVTFLCTDKDKSPKEIRPGAPAASQDEAVPSVSSLHRALDQLAGRELRASGSNTVSLNYSRWAAVLGARYGVWSNALPCRSFAQPALQGLWDRLILHSHAGL